jgi:rhamnosyltransferase
LLESSKNNRFLKHAQRDRKVIGVVVTYHPSFKQLNELLLALRLQLEGVVIVDNGSPDDVKNWLSPHLCVGVHGIFLDRNLGIAAAQNMGVAWAREQGASHVMLLDQDSLPSPDMTTRLLDAIHAMTSRGYQVAAAGPCFVDMRRAHPSPFSRVEGMALRRIDCGKAAEIVITDYLVASGCLIPSSIFEAIGMMREDFFIDYVDIEWGLRAKRLGFVSLGVCGAKMKHDLGDVPIKFFGRAYPVRSPLRHYYIFRNAVWLYCHAPIPLNWKLVDGWRLFLKFVFYAFFAEPRWGHVRMMSLGIWHGLTNRLGAFQPQ